MTKTKYLTILLTLFLCNVSAQTNEQYTRLSKEEWIKTSIDVDKWSEQALSVSFGGKSIPSHFLVIHEVREAEYDGAVQHILMNCVGTYNSDMLKFKIWELNSVSNAKCKVVISGKQEDSGSFSTFFFATSDLELEKLIDMHQSELSLVKVPDKKYFRSQSVSSESDFCWKLSQLKNAVERYSIDLEMKKQEEIENKRPEISISIGGGLHSFNLKNSQEVYNIDDSRSAVSNINFSALFHLHRNNNYISFYAGPYLQYEKVDCFMKINDFRNAAPLINSGLDSIVIYGNGIIERNSYRSLSLGCDFRVKRVSKRGVAIAFSLIPYFRFPFTISSSLSDGTFNYRGRLAYIGEEIVSIPELGLKERVTIDNYKTIENTFGGFGFVSKFSIGFENRNHGFHVSPSVGLEKFSSKSLNSADNNYLSSYLNDYNPTWIIRSKFTLLRYGIFVDYVYKFKMGYE